MSDVRKKIMIAAEIYPPDIGGPATYAHALVESLKLKGYNVSLVTFGDAGKSIGEGKEAIVVDRRHTACIRLLVYLSIVLKLTRKANVIYAMGPGVSGWCSIMVGKLMRKRVVVKVTGDRAWETAQLMGSAESIVAFQTKRHRGQVRVFEWMERWVVRKADAVIVPGNFLKTIVKGWGAQEERVWLIPNAIGEGMGGVHGSTPVQNIQNAVILAVGRLVPWKGFDDVIMALPRVRENVQDATLTIVGDGLELEHLKKIAQEHGVDGVVAFPGSMRQSALIDCWRHAKVFVLVSGYEGFPHVVLESWAAGVPVIASDIPANRDIIKNGENGLLVPYKDQKAIADAIVNILTDHRLSQGLIENGKKERKNYTWESVFEGTEKVVLN